MTEDIIGVEITRQSQQVLTLRVEIDSNEYDPSNTFWEIEGDSDSYEIDQSQGDINSIAIYYDAPLILKLTNGNLVKYFNLQALDLNINSIVDVRGESKELIYPDLSNAKNYNIEIKQDVASEIVPITIVPYGVIIEQSLFKAQIDWNYTLAGPRLIKKTTYIN